MSKVWVLNLITGFYQDKTYIMGIFETEKEATDLQKKMYADVGRSNSVVSYELGRTYEAEILEAMED